MTLTDNRPSDLVKLIQKAEKVVEELDADDIARQRDVFQRSIRRIELSASLIKIDLDRSGLAVILGLDPINLGQEDIVLKAPAQLRRRGVEARLVIDGPAETRSPPDPRLCRLVAKAHLWFRKLETGEMASIRAIARHEGIHECDVSRNLRLAFLAPDIVEAITDGCLPVDLTAERLRRLPQLPADWRAQRRLLGFTSQ